MNLKFFIPAVMVFSAVTLFGQTPVYLDNSADIEDRIDDVMKRLTTEEKVAMLHAQSKFSSPGVKRLGIPDIWMTDGPHGIRPEVLWDEFMRSFPCPFMPRSHME